MAKGNRNKEVDVEKTLEKTSGGYSDYSEGIFYEQRFVIDENEARLLNIAPGKYARSDLAREILEKTPNLTSAQYQAISSGNTAAKMRSALNAIGLKRR